jgi:predicted unusual protein kinase regulating ubiquinone biosynthesis (AarF/ABC1/UbiB family)
MRISLEPNQLQRYKEIGLLLWKYGQSDLGEIIGSEDLFDASFGKEAIKPKLEELGADLEKLGPSFVKIGQLLARRPDLLPVPYVEVLSHLQEHFDPLPLSKVEEVFEAETGIRLCNAFVKFDATPVKVSASGQTHHAVLREGQEVIVKIQRPGVKEQVLEDLEILDKVAQFCDSHTQSGKRFDFSGALDQIRKAMLAELDYRQEAHNLRALKTNLKDLEMIVLPVPIDFYSSASVLTMSYIEGKKVSEIEKSELLTEERTKLAEQVFYAYLQQILVDGLVDAEPDPEKILLTKNHKLALLDLGIVARISPAMQEKLLQLLLDINEGRAEHLCEIVISIGQKRELFDEVSFRVAVSELVLTHRDMRIEQLGVGKVLLGIAHASATSGLTIPSEVSMLGTALLNMHNVAHMLAPHFDSKAFLRRNVSELTRRHVLQTFAPGNLFHNAIEAAELLEKLPGKVGKILDSIADNKLKVTVHAIDEQVLISGFQKIANRITVGLVLAALIIGASMLMRVQTKFSIWGYPGFAMLCFIVAAGFGCALVVEILISDRKAH